MRSIILSLFTILAVFASAAAVQACPVAIQSYAPCAVAVPQVAVQAYAAPVAVQSFAVQAYVPYVQSYAVQAFAAPVVVQQKAFVQKAVVFQRPRRFSPVRSFFSAIRANRGVILSH